jgi:hypothetical protein
VDPTALLGDAFCATHGLSNASVATVATHLPPSLLLNGHKTLAPTLSNATPVVVPVADLFAPSATSTLPLSYSIAAAAAGNPRSNATLAGSNLTVVGAWRGDTYYVLVSAVDATGTAPSAPAAVRVTEAAAPPIVRVATMPAVASLAVGACNVPLWPYFSDPTGASTALTYSVLSAPHSNAAVSACNLVLTGSAARAGVNYTVVVGARNAYGVSASNWTSVTEAAVVVQVGQQFPVVALTATTQTIAGQAYGNGTYVLTGSPNVTGLVGLTDVPDVGSSWAGTPASYTVTTGAYVGAVTTTVSGVAQAGEWFQIQVPYAITLTKYRICTVDQNYAPGSWVLAASTDGTTWTSVDDQPPPAGQAFRAVQRADLYFAVAPTAAYTRYRLIMRKTNGTVMGALITFVVYGY